MLGQSFFPGGDEQQRQQQEGMGPVNPVQKAIKVLSLKLPRFLGNAPAPPQLLTGLGGAGLPTAGGSAMPRGGAPPGGAMPGVGAPPFQDNPLVTILQRLFTGAPQAPSGPPQAPPSAPPATDAFQPKVKYEDPRGALPFTPTVLPTTYDGEPAPSDIKPPLPAGGRRVFSV